LFVWILTNPFWNHRSSSFIHLDGQHLMLFSNMRSKNSFEFSFKIWRKTVTNRSDMKINNILMEFHTTVTWTSFSNHCWQLIWV
jgi:hypothetical protein